MILVKLKSNTQPEIIYEGDKYQIEKKVRQLGLYCWAQMFFFKNINDMGFNGGNYEYYTVYESEERMNIYLGLNGI